MTIPAWHEEPIAKHHDRTCCASFFDNRRTDVFHRHCAAILSPEDGGRHAMHQAVLQGRIDGTLLCRIGAIVGSRVMEQAVHRPIDQFERFVAE